VAQHLYHTKKVSKPLLDDVVKELRWVPRAFWKDPLAVIGWWYHLEFEYTPWQDSKKLYYRHESYVKKKHLCQKRDGTWGLRHELFRELLV
jgi:hypothetical protein